MTRERTSQAGRRAVSAVTPNSGATAALQLVPVAAWMVDESAALQGCNELFEAIAGVPHEILLGREWWQAFAARSAEIASSAHDAIVTGSDVRGEVSLDLFASDGSLRPLSIRWLRVTEPGTRRPLWILSAFELARDAPASLKGRSAEGSTEMSALLARELDALSSELSVERCDRATAVERLSRVSAALRVTPSSGPAQLPLSDVIKRALSATLHDPERPVRLRAEASGALVAQPIDPARPLSLVVEHARARCASPPVSVRIFDCSNGVCFEVQDYGPPLDAELQARIVAPRLFDRDPALPAASPLEIASAMVRALGGRFEFACSLSGPQVVRFSIPR